MILQVVTAKDCIFLCHYPILPPLTGDHEVAAKLTCQRRMGECGICANCNETKMFINDPTVDEYGYFCNYLVGNYI